MREYVNAEKLQEYTTKLVNKLKTIFPGQPIAIDTAAGMTDTNKIYVYVGDETGYNNGHWYYYSGSAWVDGGVWNATALVTDTTLTEAGEAADAKATGDAVRYLEEIAQNTSPAAYNSHENEETNSRNLDNIWQISDSVYRYAKSFVIKFSPQQDGTPTAETPVAITGSTSPNVRVGKGNLYDGSRKTKTFLSDTGTEVTGGSYDGYQITNYIDVSGISDIRITYYNSQSNPRSNKIAFYDFNKTFISINKPSNVLANHWKTIENISVPENAVYMIVGTATLSPNYMVIMGDNVSYAPVLPHEASPLYGGTIDIVSGIITVTWGEIADYDGETLPGVWMSSMDVYQEGTTPTAHAQVVYELENPLYYRITSASVQMYDGKTCAQSVISNPKQRGIMAEYVASDLLTRANIDSTLTQDGSLAETNIVRSVIFTKEIPIFPSYFYAHRYTNSDGSLGTGDAYASSISMTVDAPLYVETDDPLYQARFVNNGILYPYGQRAISTGLAGGRIVFKRTDGQELTTADLAHFKVFSNEAGYLNFVENRQFKITNTKRFPDSGNNGIAKIKLDYTYGSPTFGMQRNDSGYTAYRANYIPYYADTDLDIWIGRDGSITAYLLIDGVSTKLSFGQYIKVPAGTRFNVCFTTSPADYSGDFQRACIMVVANTKPAGFVQTMYSAGTNTAIQCACRVGDKTIIATAGNKYAIYQSTDSGTETIVELTDIGHDIGHANQGNYSDGNFYISNWENNSLIHVFAFDNEENTLTYSKDIVIPVDSEFQRIGYQVFDNEKQIYFFGWLSGREAMVYGLYIKYGDTYKQAWKRYANIPNILNGFVFQGNYLYYPDNYLINGVYRFNNIFRINMITGETEYNSYTPSGNIMQQESEAIIAVGESTFLLPVHLGGVYMITFVKG